MFATISEVVWIGKRTYIIRLISQKGTSCPSFFPFRINCVQQGKKLIVVKMSQLQTQLFASGDCSTFTYILIIYIGISYFFEFLFSPCSGLVVSGYSKTETDKSLNLFLAKVKKPYEKFKKMYTIGNDYKSEFTGNQTYL